MNEKLALHGGPRAKSTPFNTPSRYGSEELKLVTEALQEGRLMGPGGKVEDFERVAAEYYGVAHAVMVSSGTTAIHTALTALGVAEGDEVLTTPMTDIGTVSAILAIHAIPTFTDIDLATRLVDPASLEERITARTKAVIVVHMAGLPCSMDRVMAIASKRGLRVLEDCAQSHGGRYGGRYLGTFGDAAAFSMNESKQVSTGDGGFVLTDDGEVAGIAGQFRDKTYVRTGVPRGGQPIPFFALNYRPTALQAAVGIAQMGRLGESVARRDQIVRRYYRELGDLPQLEFPEICAGGEASWWPLPVRYTAGDPPRSELVEALAAEGIPIDTSMSTVRNILRSELFLKKRYYPLTDRIPSFWRDTEYDPDSCPNVDELGRTVFRLPVDPRYTDEDITQTVAAVRKVFRYYFG